eukprot:CAMPEP_0184322340 /NCGR_PEP_ID=MMETSP1049-20130417/124021_1 /TAXON_ID=77928 /ORGANISM="Proteomonas sulcata, Strain CCMP704" /LENGTH=126 /DNA_ID=CAMNT_0026643443 /DNA_START=94 /DNA_END=471 /DNA_ORIENTATION=+
MAAPMQVNLSEEQQEQLGALQEKFTAQRKQLVQIHNNMIVFDKEKKRHLLTIDELEKLPEEVKTYKAVGKMFIMEPFSDIKTGIKTTCETLDNKVAQSKQAKEAAEAAIEETQKQMRELIKAGTGP